MNLLKTVRARQYKQRTGGVIWNTPDQVGKYFPVRIRAELGIGSTCGGLWGNQLLASLSLSSLDRISCHKKYERDTETHVTIGQHLLLIMEIVTQSRTQTWPWLVRPIYNIVSGHLLSQPDPLPTIEWRDHDWSLYKLILKSQALVNTR